MLGALFPLCMTTIWTVPHAKLKFMELLPWVSISRMGSFPCKFLVQRHLYCDLLGAQPDVPRPFPTDYLNTFKSEICLPSFNSATSFTIMFTYFLVCFWPHYVSDHWLLYQICFFVFWDSRTVCVTYAHDIGKKQKNFTCKITDGLPSHQEYTHSEYFF